MDWKPRDWQVNIHYPESADCEDAESLTNKVAVTGDMYRDPFKETGDPATVAGQYGQAHVRGSLNKSGN